MHVALTVYFMHVALKIIPFNSPVLAALVQAVKHCLRFIGDVMYPPRHIIHFLASAVLPAPTNEVVQARCMVADNKLHYIVSFTTASAALVPCSACTSPMLHWHRLHYSRIGGALFGQPEQT